MLLPSILRTLVPLLVGWLVALGVHLDDSSLTAAVTAVVSAAYYAVLRVAERAADRLDSPRLRKVAGALLGWAAEPEYQPVKSRK